MGFSPRPSPGAARVDALHVCPACGSRLVQAETWSQPDPERWELVLRCPECLRVETGRFKRPEAESFLRRRDRAAADLHLLAERLELERFVAEGDAFFSALRTDAIEPTDF
jgi:hypothetical protein